MGWGTTIKTEIYLSRMIFENRGLLEDEIEELEKTIERNKQEILMYCSANPKDIVPKDLDEEAIGFISNKVNDLLNDIEYNSVMLYKLNLLLENFEERISG